MKELTIEQKAKAYDEAIERANAAHKDEDRHLKATLERIFPELAESEDERIRKRIIALINAHGQSMYKDEMLAWLEGQKTSEEALQYLKENHSPSEVSDFQAAMNIAVAKAYDKGIKDGLEKQGEKPIGIRSRHATGKLAEIIKDIESADKVEPKFHEGDWVVLTAGELSTTLQIVKVDTNKRLYWFNDSRYLPIVDEECLHLWTIQDAKDGDVLADKYKNIGIFQKCEGRCWHSYIYLGCDGELRGFSIGGSHEQIDTHPATKEQREQLEKAMADARYTFDFDKKELKEIEQNQIMDYPDSLPKDKWELVHEFVEKFGRIPKDEDELNALVEYVLKRQKPTECNDADELSCFESALFTAFSYAWQSYLLGEEVNVKQWAKEQSKELLEAAKEELNEHNTAWSEEDKEKLDRIISIIHCYTGTVQEENELNSWLKSLKERYTWNIIDEEMKEALQTEYAKGRADAIAEMQKSAWSEEDEAWLKESELIICFFTNDESCRNEYLNWLKSLKQRIGG